jgi:hypothetical protein
MKKLLTFILIVATWSTINAQNDLIVTLDESSKVSKEGEGGLFFAGTRDINYRFSQRISPHGDCVDVINGYAFVTWYKGGMDKRNLMLSRKNLTVDNSPWVTIEFPHRHIGQGGELFNGKGIRGDSHNTAAIGISTIDNTIHIIYDLHAYSKSSLPTVFFNYSVSKKDMAFVSDEEFTLDIFNPKQTYLKEGQNYERMTYPMIHRATDGSLVARYRKGGSGNGDILMAHYNGTAWTNNWVFQDGSLPQPNRNSLYGGERFINGKFYAGFSIRYATNNSSSTSNGFSLNSGLYYAYTNGIPKNQSGTQWFDVNDKPISLPIKNNINPSLDPVQIGQPGDDFGTATLPRSSSDPAWTVTENGTIHFVQRVDNRNVHYYKKAGDANFSKNAGGLIPNPEVRGEVYSFNSHVFMVEIIGGRIHVKATPEGENNWKIVYRGTESIEFDHFDAFVEEDKLYVYLMEDTNNNTVGVGDTRPLYFQEFTLSEIAGDDGSSIVLEAEDFTSATTGVVVSDNTAASKGKIIGEFRTNQFIEYKFNVDAPGSYDFNLFAANRNRDDSTMDIEINGRLFSNVNITRTFDWDIYLSSTIANINLVSGENTIKLVQKRSLSSRLDRIVLNANEVLNTNAFNENSFSIYPNPSNGVIKINANSKNVSYQLISIQGRILEQGSLENNTLDFSNKAKGLYILRLSSKNNTTFIKRIVLE